jgi:predicted  nucleic acid-binding Zn-ribbon protein
LEEAFHKILESKLKDKTIHEFEGENLKIKVEIYQKFDDGGASLLKEREKIKNRITTLQKDISQYENNLSFFGNSKGADALMKDVYSKMDLLNNKITDLKEKLNLIRTSLKE